MCPAAYRDTAGSRRELSFTRRGRGWVPRVGRNRLLGCGFAPSEQRRRGNNNKDRGCDACQPSCVSMSHTNLPWKVAPRGYCQLDGRDFKNEWLIWLIGPVFRSPCTPKWPAFWI